MGMVGGDQDPDMERSSLEMFNRKTGSWSAGPDTLHRRDSSRLVSLDDHLYAIGGYDNRELKVLNTCERFSLRTGEWEQVGKMRVGRRSAGVVSHKGHIFAVGGMGTKKDLKSIEI